MSGSAPKNNPKGKAKRLPLRRDAGPSGPSRAPEVDDVVFADGGLAAVTVTANRVEGVCVSSSAFAGVRTDLIGRPVSLGLPTLPANDLSNLGG
jgi:hypothetical protein